METFTQEIKTSVRNFTKGNEIAEIQVSELEIGDHQSDLCYCSQVFYHCHSDDTSRPCDYAIG